ncbi:hypothetical protein [Paenibacillus prosopidis]|uniref:Uncharacterized protein n=1 Tax=Paenibacillus prosopidis TaxID=630520 RepID=A0A368W1U7_9BACL|nr:hypothetical protein [Paenibacillus prosopidis]RCW48485.1 hypothetical protein DFP97_106185 [Paenibacillus prosopidis]
MIRYRSAGDAFGIADSHVNEIVRMFLNVRHVRDTPSLLVPELSNGETSKSSGIRCLNPSSQW